MTRYFVWVPSSLGPSAQIWHDIQTDGNGKPQKTLALFPLPDDDDERELEQLKQAYPYEEK